MDLVNAVQPADRENADRPTPCGGLQMISQRLTVIICSRIRLVAAYSFKEFAAIDVPSPIL